MNLVHLHAHTDVTFAKVRPILEPIFNNARESDRATNVMVFAKRINAALKRFKIRIKVTEEETAAPNTEGHFYPYVAGFCNPSDTNALASIYVVISVFHKVKRLSLSKDAWENFKYRVYTTILHELVHRAQFKHGYKRRATLVFRPDACAKTNKALYTDQKYFGEIDEVEAYARDLVEDWYYWWPEEPFSIRFLKKLFRARDQRLYTIRNYSNAYEGDVNHPAVVRLFRKAKQWNKLITPLAGSLMSCPTYVRLALGNTTPGSSLVLSTNAD